MTLIAIPRSGWNVCSFAKSSTTQMVNIFTFITLDTLRSLCDIYGFVFINNDIGDNRIILSEHIDYDGVHLNTLGSELLATKFGNVFVNSC